MYWQDEIVRMDDPILKKTYDKEQHYFQDLWEELNVRHIRKYAKN